MRVLFLTNIPSPYRIKFFNELAKYCDLTVVFEMIQAKNRDENWKSGEDFRFKAVFMDSIYRKEESSFCPEVKRYIKAYRKDIIIVGGYSTPTGMYSIVYMRAHRIPFILNSDGGMVKNDSVLKQRIKQFFIGSASAWLSTGTACTQYLLHYGADRKRIYQYPFASTKKSDIVGADAEQKMLLRQQLGIQEEKMILFVGSFIDRKGLDILLNACWNMEDTALVLVGGTDIEPFVPEMCKKPRVHIYVEGFKAEQDVRNYYQAADIFVLPTREDIWGLVINEAMAAGLPVITTDKCGAGVELIEDGENGYVVLAENAQLLQEKIKGILGNKEWREQMGHRNLEKIERYTIETMVEKHLEILQGIEYDRFR